LKHPEERPDPAELLPHAGPALLITAILDAHEDGIVCEGRVPAGHAYAPGEVYPSFVAIEMAAQAAAVSAALSSIAADAEWVPQVGYLVRARRIRWTRESLPAGETLVVRVRHTGGAGALRLHRVSVALDGAEVLTGDLGTFVPPAD